MRVCSPMNIENLIKENLVFEAFTAGDSKIDFLGDIRGYVSTDRFDIKSILPELTKYLKEVEDDYKPEDDMTLQIGLEDETRLHKYTNELIKIRFVSYKNDAGALTNRHYTQVKTHKIVTSSEGDSATEMDFLGSAVISEGMLSDTAQRIKEILLVLYHDSLEFEWCMLSVAKLLTRKNIDGKINKGDLKRGSILSLYSKQPIAQFTEETRIGVEKFNSNYENVNKSVLELNRLLSKIDYYISDRDLQNITCDVWESLTKDVITHPNLLNLIIGSGDLNSPIETLLLDKDTKSVTSHIMEESSKDYLIENLRRQSFYSVGRKEQLHSLYTSLSDNNFILASTDIRDVRVEDTTGLLLDETGARISVLLPDCLHREDVETIGYIHSVGTIIVQGINETKTFYISLPLIDTLVGLNFNVHPKTLVSSGNTRCFPNNWKEM